MPTGTGLLAHGLRVYRDERIKQAFAREDRSSRAGRNVLPSQRREDHPGTGPSAVRTKLRQSSYQSL